jgi:hypothetical protein
MQVEARPMPDQKFFKPNSNGQDFLGPAVVRLMANIFKLIVLLD